MLVSYNVPNTLFLSLTELLNLSCVWKLKCPSLWKCSWLLISECTDVWKNDSPTVVDCHNISHQHERIRQNTHCNLEENTPLITGSNAARTSRITVWMLNLRPSQTWCSFLLLRPDWTVTDIQGESSACASMALHETGDLTTFKPS